MRRSASPLETKARLAGRAGEGAPQLLPVEGFAAQQALAAAQIVADGRQRLVQLVGERRGHLAQRRQARDVHQFRLQVLQPPLGALALGEIADEAGEQPPLAPADHLADRELHGEGGAVAPLADDDAADADDPPLAGRPVAIQIGVVLLAIGRRHQDRNVLADRLVGPPAEQALGGGAE
jgi:hypothetical protein